MIKTGSYRKLYTAVETIKKKKVDSSRNQWWNNYTNQQFCLWV